MTTSVEVRQQLVTALTLDIPHSNGLKLAISNRPVQGTTKLPPGTKAININNSGLLYGAQLWATMIGWSSSLSGDLLPQKF